MESDHKSFMISSIVGIVVLGAVLGGFTKCTVDVGAQSTQEYIACVQAGNEPIACRGKVVTNHVDR